MIRKKFIGIVDNLTAILLLMQLQSLICYLIERPEFFWENRIFVYMGTYYIEGIMHAIYRSPFRELLLRFGYIIFFSNIAVLILKIWDLHFAKEKAVKGWHRHFIAVNVIFILWRLIEYYRWYSV